MIKTCCQELIALASHHYDKWPSHLSCYCQKREKIFGDDVITKAERGEWDNAGGHQRASLASLAEITLEGHVLKLHLQFRTARFVHVDLPFVIFSPLSRIDLRCCTVNCVSERTESLARFSDDPLVTYCRHFTWKCQIGFLMMNMPRQDLWCFISISNKQHNSDECAPAI